MKRLTLATVMLAGSLLGQRQPYNAATMSPYRAMPSLPGATPGNILNPGGATSLHPNLLGGTISGSIPYTGVPHGAPHGVHPGRNRTVVVPYAVPVWAGGYYGGYANYGMPQQQPNVTVVMPQQPAPSIVINHHYGDDSQRPAVTVESAERNELKVYEGTPRKQERAAPAETAATPRSYVRDDKPNIYMVVMKDGTVRQAIGYWVEGSLLRYVTPQATVGNVVVHDIDREATARLNAQNKLEMDIPLEIQ